MAGEGLTVVHPADEQRRTMADVKVGDMIGHPGDSWWQGVVVEIRPGKYPTTWRVVLEGGTELVTGPTAPVVIKASTDWPGLCASCGHFGRRGREAGSFNSVCYRCGFGADVSVPCGRTLRRGGHVLPHQAQVLGRDLDGERILQHLGGVAVGYRLTGEQLEERRAGRAPGLPYEYLVRAPGSPSSSWRGFFTKVDLAEWMAAYDLRVEVPAPEPGSSFSLRLPVSADRWLEVGS